MNYSRQFISEIGFKTGFINSNIEKVIRLLDVLVYIDKELDPKHEKLVLKGGTAINLIYMGLKRLSVDIDLDYIGSLDKEVAIKDRIAISEMLDDFMMKNGYTFSPKSRASSILESRMYSYINAFGNKDNIKIEINYIDRIHIYDASVQKISFFGKSVNVKSPAKEELFGMKVCALLDRGKPRDLYDVSNIAARTKELDEIKLKKSIIFYCSLDGIYTLEKDGFPNVELISYSEVRRELLPVLSKNELFSFQNTKERVINWLNHILVLTDDEKQYLQCFSEGDYTPQLLLDDVIAERILNHPMAKWRIFSMKK